MKTIIIYESAHHGNTKKLVDAIVKKYGIKGISIDEAEYTAYVFRCVLIELRYV